MNIIKKIISSTIVAAFAIGSLMLPVNPVYAATPQGTIYQQDRNKKIIEDMQLYYAWNQTQGSSDIKITIVDSAVDFNSLSLFCNYNKTPKGHDFEGGDYCWKTGEDAHGTQVAQSVLLSCPNATIFAYDTHGEGNKDSRYTFYNSYGTKDVDYDKMFVDITNRSIEDDIDIIVISTALGNANNYSNTLNALQNFDGLVFKSAGNHEGLIDTHNTTEVMSFWYANGQYDNIVIVGGYDVYDMNNTEFNYSPNHVAIAGSESIVAYSPITHSAETVFGTSYATPIVAGVAALLWSYYPDATAQQIRTAITDSSCVNPMTGSMVYNKAGGRVNAFKSMNYVENNYLPLKDGKLYYIRNKETNKYLSNNNNNTLTQTSSATSNSKWLVTYLANGYYYITTPNTLYYFDVYNALDIENNPIKLFGYSGYPSAQTFKIVKDIAGFSQIYPKLSTTRVLNLKSQTASPTLNTVNISNSQKWKFMLTN